MLVTKVFVCFSCFTGGLTVSSHTQWSRREKHDGLEMLSWLDVQELLRIPLLEMHAWLEMPSDNVYVERPEQHLNAREGTKTVTTSG